MAPKSHTAAPDKIARIKIVIHELTNQTDRGAAIVGAAWVEEALLTTLRSLLKDQPKAWDRMFEGYGPLNSFSAKIDLLALLGLTTEAICNDLHSIRKIRNQFAHDVTHAATHEQLSFDSDGIKTKSLALKCVAHEQLTNPRQAFIRACAVLYADFESVSNFVGLPHLGTVMAAAELD